MRSAPSPRSSAPRLAPARSVASRLSHGLAIVMVALVGLLLVEVLFEGWLQTLFGGRTTDARGAVVLDPPRWPKVIKNGLYLTLAALTVVKVALDRRWREFRTGADLALAALGGVMVLAGLVGGSSPELMGEAVFVYFRGAIVFYALRAADPPGRWVRPVLVAVGAVVAVNVLVALVQMLVGAPAYTGLGWTELNWANTNRAHALLTHPNHLGHVLSLTLLGLLAWMVTRERVPIRWWAAFGVVALALSATQSRESIIAVMLAAGVIWVLGRVRGSARPGIGRPGVGRPGVGRRILTAVALIAVFAAAQVAVRPANRAEWERRWNGVVSAFRVPSGEEPGTRSPRPAPSPSAAPTRAPAPGGSSTPGPAGTRPPGGARPPAGTRSPGPAAAAPKAPPREIRVLFYQQGLRLLARQPLLGYGIGQFGGIVAEENDPNWHRNPRFGPEGFNRHGFRSKQVDSFWLHLTVETGIAGLIAYLCWLLFLILPLLRRRDPFAVWGVAVVAFAVQVAFLSASLEDPLLPALLFTVLGAAWLAPRWDPGGDRPDATGSGVLPTPDPPDTIALARRTGQHIA